MDGGAENDVGNVTAALLRSAAAVTAAGLSFSTGALARSLCKAGPIFILSFYGRPM